ncbi:MAG: DegT/DnrJ/EryC1/StrS family aminotransferase [Nanoarchaeota archaeon]|nr:DegT/DnrJ/EryC1/StrS family aminotransferase [Nanoarchaeota archaeon]MBU4124210.1 DegT/DnrJ/EryC1/StrS family aminotransferase [Nanoarchaeota archaeon]
MSIPLAKPSYTQEMEDAAINAMRNEKWCLGESVFKFEEEFAKYCGVKYAVAVSSGTDALTLALISMGVKKSDNIMTSPNSFIASANAIVHSGATPVFSDIRAETGNIDPDKISAKNLRGIIPVHIYGNMCDMDKIMALKENGMFVIEDACQAHGADYKGKKAGSIGDLGCFSFYPSKNMTVYGDGGMITSNNEEIIEYLKSLRDCGRVSRYEHDKFGFTSRMNTINAAIGRVQLKYLDEWNQKRRAAAKIYQKLLPEEILLKPENGSNPIYHMFVIKSDKRDDIIKNLDKNNIGNGIHYPIPIHLQPIYKKTFGFKDGLFPVTEKFSKQIMSLPMYPEITEDQIKMVVEKVLEVL